jgi:cell wall-associated NlpC family hydrolase
VTGLELARAAAALVGVPWRLHGRDPATGLDCIGLLGAALGQDDGLPTGYPLRLRRLAGWLPDPASLGFVPACGGAHPGDVVLLRLGPAQHHLGIAADPSGWIHAHAGLRRVVHQPQLPAGEWIGHWRRTTI